MDTRSISHGHARAYVLVMKVRDGLSSSVGNKAKEVSASGVHFDINE